MLKGMTIIGALILSILGPILSVPEDLFASSFVISWKIAFICTGGIEHV